MDPETEALLRRKLEREERARKSAQGCTWVALALVGAAIFGVWSMLNSAANDPHRQVPPYPICVNAPDGRGGYREVCSHRRHYADDPPEPIRTEIGVWCNTFDDGSGTMTVRLFQVEQPAGGRIEEARTHYEIDTEVDTEVVRNFRTSSVTMPVQRHGDTGDTYVLGSSVESENPAWRYQVTPDGLWSFRDEEEKLLPEGRCR